MFKNTDNEKDNIKYSKSEERWLEDFDVDVSLLKNLIVESTELGTEVLKDSKYNSILNPFDLEWTFGVDISVPLISLADEHRKEIFYSSSNIGVLYNYCLKQQVHLKGHQGKITSAAADSTGHWLVTADNGQENLILIWDTQTHALVWTIFNHAPGNDLKLVALSPNGKLLITITNHNGTTIDFWLWTFGEDKPNESYTSDSALGSPKSIEFHPNKEEHVMIIFDRAVLFFVWDWESSKISVFNECEAPLKSGFFTDGTYVDLCHECFVSTTKGSILIFGNTIYTKNFVALEELDNQKSFIKNVIICKTTINCIKTIHELIVTGDSNGVVMFFDKRLKLLYWLSKQITESIRCISFKTNKRKYKIVEDPFPDEDNKSFDDTINSCEDRSEEYEIRIQTKIPSDCTLERKLFIIEDFFITTSDGTVYFTNSTNKEFIPLFPKNDGHIAAIDVHDELPYIILAYYKGYITILNYLTHQEVISANVPETESDAFISTIKYSPQCLHLACGKTNGELWLLQPALLSQIYIDPFKFSENKIIQVEFSPNSSRMAYYDSNNTIFGFYYDVETEDWIFKGKVRTHYKEICHMLFDDEPPFAIYTIGKDRHLIKYTDLSLNDDELDVLTRDRIDQKDLPVYFIKYPKRKFSKAAYFLIADDKHKFKVVSSNTLMTMAVYLGPAYGCFKDNYVLKMEFLPSLNKKYLIFMTKKQIGIQLMPIDGNPFKFVGCLGHPDELLDFQISPDGNYIFTIGRNDNTVQKWKINVLSVESMNQLGGSELQPFYCLLEGGRSGFLFQEMRDLFYYMQILQQGESVCAPRTVTNSINLGELPDLLRACGYYPSEYEIENLLTDMRYKDFDDTGILKDQVTFCEFVQLFINHKPAYGYTVEELEGAFETITTFAEEYGPPEMSKEDFIEAMTTTGEQINTEQIFRCLSTLMHATHSNDPLGEREFEFLPDTIDFDYFTEDILGIDMSTVQRGEAVDDNSNNESSH